MVLDERTHASFFSGVGGLDLGLERAGWRTVSFSEIDPYASAVLAERWPGVPNLGDITDLARRGSGERSGEQLRQHADSGAELRPDERASVRLHGGASGGAEDREWHRAFLWTGGFPCQDLSVAGKRRGMVEGTRSNLAYAFLALVERHRPPAILLENVPGLLSSHGGRDMAALLGAVAELGYGVAYRVLDARHFGVPQRRRRVFILGLRSDPDDPEGRLAAECAAAVLAVGTRCPRHPAAGTEEGTPASYGTPLGSDEFVGPVDGALGHKGVAYPQQSVNMGHIRVSGPIRAGGQRLTRQELDDIPSLVVGEEADANRVRGADGLASRLDDRGELAGPILSTGQGGQRTTDLNTPLVFTKAGRAQTSEDAESWREGGVMPTLNSFDVGDIRTTAAIVGTDEGDDPLLPLGLDSHRYRCCGNGVVANVAEWLGRRLIEAAA